MEFGNMIFICVLTVIMSLINGMGVKEAINEFKNAHYIGFGSYLTLVIISIALNTTAIILKFGSVYNGFFQ